MSLPYNYPEKMGEVASSRKRIQAATELFETNFHDNGKPKTEKGKQLYKKYEVRSYRYPGLMKRLYRRLRYKLRSVFAQGNRK